MCRENLQGVEINLHAFFTSALEYSDALLGPETPQKVFVWGSDRQIFVVVQTE
jgi:hypothetical protein